MQSVPNPFKTSDPSAGNLRRVALSAAVVLAAAAGLTGAAGCLRVAPPAADFASRHVGSPDRFAAATDAGRADAGDVLSGWLASFDDPQLRDLVREAWDKNPDLYAAAARFEEAAASLRVATSLLFPQVNGLATAQRQDFGSGPSDTYLIGVGVSWEIDLWGRLRADRALAGNLAAANGLDFIQARHSLAATVAGAYFALTTAKEQLDIDRQLLDAQSFTATTTQQRVDSGVGVPFDLDVAEANRRLAEASIQQDLQAIQEAARSLEILLGRYPAATVSGEEHLPQLPAGPVATGVPSALLERRPDVRAAARRVDAAYYDVRSAQAARLPTLTLTGQAGTAIDPADLITQLAADLVAPLFTGGRLQSLEAAADARQRQALGNYASIALQGFREVESALANERYLAERQAQLDVASERLQKASNSAQSRYEQGVLTILNLQQVRLQDFATRSQLLQVRFQQLQTRLNLYLALGGPPVAPTPRTDVVPSMNDLLDRQFVEPLAGPITPVSSGKIRVGMAGNVTPGQAATDNSAAAKQMTSTAAGQSTNEAANTAAKQPQETSDDN